MNCCSLLCSRIRHIQLNPEIVFSRFLIQIKQFIVVAEVICAKYNGCLIASFRNLHLRGNIKQGACRSIQRKLVCSDPLSTCPRIQSSAEF